MFISLGDCFQPPRIGVPPPGPPPLDGRGLPPPGRPADWARGAPLGTLLDFCFPLLFSSPLLVVLTVSVDLFLFLSCRFFGPDAAKVFIRCDCRRFPFLRQVCWTPSTLGPLWLLSTEVRFVPKRFHRFSFLSFLFFLRIFSFPRDPVFF